MDERLKFIARLLDGENMAGLCREFGDQRCMPCSTATAWSHAEEGGGTGQPGPGSPFPANRMISGVPTTRESSCSGIGAIAIR